MELQEQFRQVSLANMRESRLNPRKTFDPVKLADLAESVRQVGITTPLIGRPHPEDEEAVETAAGHRRLRAARLAGLEFVPVIVRNYTDEQFHEVVTVENLQREDIHPMEEAEGFADWLRIGGHTIPLLAARVAKTESYIYQRLRLLELIDPLREDFRGDRFTIGHAIALARLGATQQKDLRENYLYDRDKQAVSLRALQVAIETKVYLDLSKAVFPIADEKLVPAAGSCDRCTKRTGANALLFPEVQGKDQCLDRPCFYRKANTFAAHRLKAFEKHSDDGSKGALAISGHWATEKKGALPSGDYKIVRKGKECDYTVNAVCVEEQFHGQGEIRIGEAVKVCTYKKCRQHWGGMYDPAPRVERTTEEVKRDLAFKFKADKAAAVEAALLTAALEVAPYPFPLEMWRELARVMWGRLWHDHQVKVLARRGMKQQSSRDAERVDIMGEAIRTMDEVELAGLVAEITIKETGSRREEDGLTMQELLLSRRSKAFLQALEAEAIEPVEVAYKEKLARIDRAEEKKSKAGAAEASAKTATQPAATPAAKKKGKAKKS